jgi:hypothetical protein
MIRQAFAAVLVAFAGYSSPALATGDMVCSGEGVSIEMAVGHLEVLAVLGVTITIGDKTWSSRPEQIPGTPITVGQAYGDDRQMLVDITDDIVNEVLGRLMVFTASESGDHALGGVFSMKGEGAFAVSCSETG